MNTFSAPFACLVSVSHASQNVDTGFAADVLRNALTGGNPPIPCMHH